MSIILLNSKTHIPAIRSEQVLRARLLARLNAGIQGKLTLISAPAGFGKTTLIRAWVEQNQLATAWFSVAQDDNDPVQFWAYFMTALQIVSKDLARDFLAILSHSPSALSDAFLCSLLNEIGNLSTPFAFVLDDYHNIENPRIQDSVLFCLDHMPPEMHLVISSRADPPWPLARLRSWRELVEIRTKDLRFTLSETESFLNQVMGLNLSTDDVLQLDHRTEGWAAGLQMAALSIRGRENVSAYVQDFAGSNRFIFDYLVEEVLACQTPEVTDFLLKTSILERLSAPLCDVLIERHDSRAIIRYLDQTNLFLNPLDDQRKWYSYHRLFKDLLYTQLQQVYPDQIPNLHLRASVWLAENNQVVEAVFHAVQSGDHEQIASLVEQHALEMVYHRELKTLQGWLDALPDSMIDARPWLSIAYAWILVNASQFENLERYLEHAKSQMDDLDETEKTRLLGHIYAIRAYYEGQNGEYRSAAELGQQALRYLPEDDTTRSWTSIGIAHNWRKLGDLETAEIAYRRAIEINAVLGNQQDQPHALVGLANIQEASGKLHQAALSYQSILQSIDQQTQKGGWFPISGFVHSRLGSIYLEWNDLEKASHYTEIGMNLSERWGQIDFLLYSYMQRVYALLALDKGDQAQEVILKIDQIMQTLSEWPYAVVMAYKISFLLIQGKATQASELARKCGFQHTDKFGYEHVLIYIVLARLLIALQKYDQALALLERLRNITESTGALRFTIEVLVLQAVTLVRLDRSEAAFLAFEKAIVFAEPDGYVRTFIAEGEIVRQLLERYAKQNQPSQYAKSLLRSFTKAVPIQQPDLIESLSPREIEVLEFLATSLTVPEIADQLIVSANTVRSHIKNIYGKLGVNRRLDAIRKADELNML